MRKKIVAGNWKMNLDKNGALALISELVELVQSESLRDVTIIVSPPFVHLNNVKNVVFKSKIKIAAQNCSEQVSGAYTGEIAASMLKSYDLDYVILGHSERRAYFKESHESLAQKVDSVLANEMEVIFCCGETLDQREAGNQVEVVSNQLKNSLFHLSENEFLKIVIAYEPVWAIGTGVTASTDQVQEMHAQIRKFIAEKYDKKIAENTSILYGGSCKPSNSEELFACKDVDGGLIGGASLKVNDFMDIIKSF